MSLAARTREAVRERPFLLEALRAGVVNYRAAADTLDVEGEPSSVATALRRYASDLNDREPTPRDARVTMESGVGLAEPGAERAGEALLSAGDRAVVPGAGSRTAVLATGEVGAEALAAILDRFRTAGVEVGAAGATPETAVVVVGRRDGATAVQLVEAALAAVPDAPEAGREE